MHRKFITNLSFLLLLNLLIKPFWILGIDRAVQNTVGAEEYGLYASLFSFTFLLNILLDLGITNFNNKNIAQHNQLIHKYFSGVVMLKIFLMVIYVIVCIAAGLIIGYNERQIILLSVLLFNQALTSFILYLRSNIAGLHMFKTDSIISVLDRLLMIIFCSILLWTRWMNTNFKIEWFVLAQTVSYVITAIVTFIIVLRKAHFNRLRWDYNFFLIVIKQSYPFAILILLMAFYNRIDSVMLERMLDNGAEQAGIYAQAYRLLDAANMIAYLFSALLLPMFARMIKFKQSPEELVELSFSFIAIPSIIIIAFSVFFSDELMQLLYHNNVGQSALVFSVLMNCFLAISSVYIFGTLLTANGSLKQLNMVAAAGMLLNIILNIVLIPRYEALGAAVASLITQYLTAGAQMFLAHRIFKFRFRWLLMTKYIIFLLIAFILFAYLHNLHQHWLTACLIGTLICILISFGLYLIKPKSIFVLLKQPLE